MPAYYKSTVGKFLLDNERLVAERLKSKYVDDGYFQLLSSQSKSWDQSIPLIKNTLERVVSINAKAGGWGVLFEYPLYRLRKRIDLVLIADHLVFVVELKLGAIKAELEDQNQVEEYALDLRDFHFQSRNVKLVPALWCTELRKPEIQQVVFGEQVQKPSILTTESFPTFLGTEYTSVLDLDAEPIDIDKWDASRYEPVPTIIEAATTIFSDHGVREISKADAGNLKECSQAVIQLLDEAREAGKKRLIVVTGVPGAGKTLAGLNVVHQKGGITRKRSEVTYLSGNTPLVIVLREALAQDEKKRSAKRGEKKTLKKIRHDLQSLIQHVIDFLREYYQHDATNPPFEHAIVFDEAQRAWNAKHGWEKFQRKSSEPELLIEIMNRHKDWAAIVCLVGAGQEINTGEPGMEQWGDAIAKCNNWEIVCPESAIQGGKDTAETALFPRQVPPNVRPIINDDLRLTVPMRSFRSTKLVDWVNAVLCGNPKDALDISRDLNHYPIALVRSLDACRDWLRKKTRGERRCGLLASTSAVRLRAEGLGVALTVQDKEKIHQWYLKPHGDYRSSNALEVTANEYTSQGLELDFAGVCWGGDLVRGKDRTDWEFRRLSGKKWQFVRSPEGRRHLLNKYRVFLTRAREGMVLYVPTGDFSDTTRIPIDYQGVADYLRSCGAVGCD